MKSRKYNLKDQFLIMNETHVFSTWEINLKEPFGLRSPKGENLSYPC